MSDKPSKWLDVVLSCENRYLNEDDHMIVWCKLLNDRCSKNRCPLHSEYRKELPK